MIRFCSQCGADMCYRIPECDTVTRAVCGSCGYIAYENPKIIAGVLPVYQEQVLLCERAIEPMKHWLTLPSGFMECHETLEAGALREAYEEVGIVPNLKFLFCTYSVSRVSQVYCLFLGELESPSFKEGPETRSAAFYPISEIPWEKLAFSSVRFALRQYADQHARGELHWVSGSE